MRTLRDPSSVTVTWDTLYAREPPAAQVSDKTDTYTGSPIHNEMSHHWNIDGIERMVSQYRTAGDDVVKKCICECVFVCC